ncbi:MAG: hypothetical protein QMC80_02010 [Thermoplasmatales archaeon]|nr:hypothetical protein [Thermoplasmatales archaeon]
MENSMWKKILLIGLVLVMCIPAFSGMNVSAEKANKEATAVMELPDLENWHYRIPIIVDTGDYNRTDCVLSQTINITWEIGGFGTFDNTSIRVIETSEDGTPQYEAVSQSVWINKDVLDATWIMNGTTPANTQRYYSIYFDILENGPKSAITYTEYVTTKENSQHIWVYGTDYEINYDMVKEQADDIVFFGIDGEGVGNGQFKFTDATLGRGGIAWNAPVYYFPPQCVEDTLDEIEDWTGSPYKSSDDYSGDLWIWT